MGKDSAISWCHHTHNSHWGCSKVPSDPACHNCYAESLSKRWGFKIWGNDKPRRMLSDENWRKPLAWDKAAAKLGERHRVFCASMADVFEDRRDLDPVRDRLWELTDATPNLDWLLLTKRPENIGRLCGLSEDERENVWLGTTAVTQAHYDERLPQLLANRSAIHFVSVEPQRELIDLKLPTVVDNADHGYAALDWVIVGGESGPKARTFDLRWAESAIEQCRAAGVACFIKQLGARPVQTDGLEISRVNVDHHAGADPSEWPSGLRVQEFPTPCH